MSEQSLLTFYKKLLLLFPKSYREHYAHDMALTFSDVLDEARREKGSLGMLAVFFLSFFDTITQALKQHFIQKTQRGSYMAKLQVTSPVRGFRTFFWIMTIITIILAIFPLLGLAGILYVQDYVFVLYFLILITLLVRSKKGWPLALLVGVVGIATAFVLSLILTDLFSHFDSYSLFQRFGFGDSLSSFIQNFVYTILFFAPLLLVGYFAVREIERPMFPSLWKKIDDLQSEKSEANMWKIFCWALLTGTILLIGLLILSNTTAPIGPLSYNNLTEIFSFFYAFTYGHVAELIELIVLIIVIVTSWSFTRRRLFPAAMIIGTLIVGFIGLGILAQYIALPTMPAMGGMGGIQAISDKEGMALEESCAVQSAEESNISISEARSYSNLQGTPPPGVTADLCKSLLTPRREGNLYYDGGWGSSVDSHTGVPTGFVLSGEKLPPLIAINDSPLFLFISALVIAFVIPAGITLLVAYFFRRRATR